MSTRADERRARAAEMLRKLDASLATAQVAIVAMRGDVTELREMVEGTDGQEAEADQGD